MINQSRFGTPPLGERAHAQKQAQTIVISLLKIILLSIVLACIYLQQRKHVFSYTIRDINIRAFYMQQSLHVTNTR